MIFAFLLGLITASVFSGLTYAEDHDATGNAVNTKIEYIECPVDYIQVMFDHLPADLSELNGFEKEAALLAQVIHGEANGLPAYDKSMVAWCVLNRLDMGIYGGSIQAIISAPRQFNWKSNFPVTLENDKIATDVLARWYMEKLAVFNGENSSGRTLPKQFVNFRGNGKENIFRDRNGNIYGKEMTNPYEE
jgi:hypothetical protein